MTPNTDSTPDSTPEFLTAPQLRQITGTPESTWRYWAHIGKGPASFKIGRRRVWRRAAVMAWLAEQEQQADRDPVQRHAG